MPSSNLLLGITYEDGQDVTQIALCLNNLLHHGLEKVGLNEFGKVDVGDLELLTRDGMEGLLDELAAAEEPDDDDPYHCQNCFYEGPYSAFATDLLDPSVCCPKCGRSDTVFTKDADEPEEPDAK